MALCRKVQDPRSCKSLVQVGFAEPDLITIASGYIIIEHVRELLFKFKRNPLPHNSNTIDGIDKGLGLRFQNVTHQYFDHFSLPI
jgi:hypothetical protein